MPDHRKHTPIVSGNQRGLFGAAYGAKKEGKPCPSYVPESLCRESLGVLRGHLKESKGKELPEHVRRGIEERDRIRGKVK